MFDAFARLPQWAKTLSIAAALYFAGVVTSQVYTETRAMPGQLRTTNARIDTVRADVLSVRQEQATQRGTLLRVSRHLKYVACTIRPDANIEFCANRHLLESDEDVIGGGR